MKLKLKKFDKRIIGGKEYEFTTFGHWPQTSKGFGRTPIEWRVLGGEWYHWDEYLLISEKIIDCVGVFADDEDGGDIDKFLERFYNTAFADFEKEVITKKPFLLSIEEAKKYFAKRLEGNFESCDLSRTAQGTDYAIDKKALQSYFENEHYWDEDQLGFTKGNSRWWLSDKGTKKQMNQHCRAYIHIDGGIMECGAVDKQIGIRPAIILSVEAFLCLKK